MVPGFQEALEQGVPVHPQRAADTLDTSKVRLAGALNIECHPVAHTAEERNPRVILVEDLEDRKVWRNDSESQERNKRVH